MHLNTMIGWLYREIDLSGITSPVWRLPIRPSESYDWILQRIQCSYNSDSEDPSDFDSLRWRYEIPPQNRALQDLTDDKPRPAISLTLNSGVNDLTAGTTRPKEFYFPSPEINWPLKSLENFVFEIENQTALTGTVRILFIGKFVLPKNILVGENA